ncbi:MAG TPA: ATP-binding protein [Nitrospirota bacterium]|nr:ATP-binding protein [Nitrospirota bacterium]
MHVDQLNEAFRNFTEASKSLEAYYSELKERIAYLTNELETRNQQLNEALGDTARVKEYLRAVLYNLEEAIVAVDSTGCITTMNRSAETLLQTRTADVAGRPFNSLTFSLNAVESGMMLEVRGKRYSVIVSHSDVRGADGLLQGRVILIKDVTRMRELEQQQERNQRLIAMGEMAAKLVHEIRNPLGSIELYATMLERDVEDARNRDLAHGISEGISSLNTILTNMLLFARPRKSSLTVMNLRRAIDEAVRAVRPLMDARGVVLDAAVIESSVHGDPELMKQVFMNLLINAVQAMPAGGRIDVVMERKDASIVVQVKDTGRGIERENLERIFDPFFTTKESGTGLGLVIASNIMRASGGFINVASEPGKGSTFSLTYPMLDAPSGTLQPAESQAFAALPARA